MQKIRNDHKNKRWLIWIVMALAFLVVYFHRVSPTVVMDRLMSDFKLEDGAILGSIAASYFYIYLIMQMPSGMLADTLGPRYTVTIGMVCAAVGSIIFAMAPSLLFLFIGRLTVGLGVSVVFVSILKVQSNWFSPKEYGTMTGLTILVGNLGAVIATRPLAFSVDVFGWRSSFVMIGLFSILVAVLSLFIVRDSPKGRGETSSQKLAKKKSKVYRFFVFKNIYSWHLFALVFGVYGTLIGFSGAWGVPYLMQVYELTRAQASNYMMIIAFGMIVGCPLIGFVSDKMKKRKPAVLLFSSLYLLCWLYFVLIAGGQPPLFLIYPLFFTMGLGGSVVVLAFTCAKEVNHADFSGLAASFVNVGSFLGISILQPLMGFVLDRYWEGTFLEGVKIYSPQAYLNSFIVCLVVLLITLWPVIFLKETGAENILLQDDSGRLFFTK